MLDRSPSAPSHEYRVSSIEYPVSSIEHPGGHDLNAQDTAIASARICDEHRAEDIVILDISGLAQFADYFVLCTGLSARQLKAIAESIRLKLKERGVAPLGREGEPASGWLLLDYIDVLVHIFSAESRAYYQLEMLWGDAPKVEWREDGEAD